MSIDVCLISPPSRANETMLPFGLLYISSYLQKYGGMKTEIIDIKASQYLSQQEEVRKIKDINANKQRLKSMIVERVRQAKPALVGITCLVTEVKDVLGLSADIRRIVPDTVIVVGGIHPSMYPEELLFDDSPVDYVVLGEGEETLTELASAIINKQIIQDVLGIAWFDAHGFNKTAPRPAIKNLDKIPYPTYDQIDTGYYFRPGINIIRNMFISTASIITSRGCPASCTFCVNKNLQKIMGSGRGFRQRSVEKVVDEIEYLAERYAVDGFYIWDDAFCMRKKYTFDFCEELLKRNLGLIWATETRVNLVTYEMIQAMKDAGCIQIDFGVESGSQEILKKLKKGITVEQVRNAFHWCHKIGVRPMANFMLNTPGETEDDLNKTFALAREIDACYYSMALMTPFPGTDIYELVQPKLTVDEYDLLPINYRRISDQRFKFARHDLDLEEIRYKSVVSFNSFRKRTSFLFNMAYLKRILKSRKKIEYVLALLGVVQGAAGFYITYLKFILTPSKTR